MYGKMPLNQVWLPVIFIIWSRQFSCCDKEVFCHCPILIFLWKSRWCHGYSFGVPPSLLHHNLWMAHINPLIQMPPLYSAKIQLRQSKGWVLKVVGISLNILPRRHHVRSQDIMYRQCRDHWCTSRKQPERTCFLLEALSFQLDLSSFLWQEIGLDQVWFLYFASLQILVRLPGRSEFQLPQPLFMP